MRSPEGAPPRPDLGWLRHRRAAAREPGISYLHPDRRAGAPERQAAPAPAPVPPPVPTAPPVPAPPPVATPAPTLDLSRSVVDQPPPQPESRPQPERRAPARPRRPRPDRLPYPRVRPGATRVLARPHPTVTLTRLQSGVGRLALSLVRGQGAGDLSLGLVCQTEDGHTGVVQRVGDATSVPTPGSPLPLVRLTADADGDALAVDLRGVRRLRRALLYGYSPSISVLTWNGLVVGTLHDGTRLELPFALPPLSGTVALLSIYAVEGELVLRSELEPYAGPPETAALAYGYRRGWREGRVPVA